MLKFNGIALKYSPTNENYRKEFFTIGSMRRTLSGKLLGNVRAVKRRWILTVLSDRSSFLIDLYRESAPFEFEDLDGNTCTAKIVSTIPFSGYSSVSELSITIEEV